MRSNQTRRFRPGFQNPDRPHSRTGLPIVRGFDGTVHTVTFAIGRINHRYHGIAARLRHESGGERFPVIGAKTEAQKKRRLAASGRFI